MLSTWREHPTSSGQIRVRDQLSCRVDSFRRQRAVIGNKLEKFHADLFEDLVVINYRSEVGESADVRNLPGFVHLAAI